MNDNKLITTQSNFGNEFKNIIVSNSAVLSSSKVQEIVKDVNIDVVELYNQCELLYKRGDSKQDMTKKLLKYVKNNKNRFKIFSDLASEILEESWCDKIND